ncbi:hypothetical protein J3R82DRAFT_4841 [Butyriboletus roseoflavus]|nr:hypothetical protein J3R82DRAFT_4841 [Butyriboletus roseoflavus]
MLPTTTIFRRLSTAHPTGPSCRSLLRTIHRSRLTRRQRDPPNPVSHGVENYFVDDDDTPPPNDPIYKVDATSDAAQSAYESPSGPWSRAGAETEEYQTVSKDEPYDVPGDPDVKPRYGGMKRYAEGKPETSQAGEGPGPEGTERWGRKPEGRA